MNILSNFVERLNELISEYGINQKQLAEATGLTATSIGNYLCGKSEPSIKSLIALADYFKCSIDYLLGKTSEYTEINFSKCPSVAERIKFMSNKNGYSGYYICKKAEIPEGSFYDWKNGKTEPTLDNLEKLVSFFDCSFDEFLGRVK